MRVQNKMNNTGAGDAKQAPYVWSLLRVAGSCIIHFVLNTHVLSTSYTSTTSAFMLSYYALVVDV
jgi:hypothetical protein